MHFDGVNLSTKIKIRIIHSFTGKPSKAFVHLLKSFVAHLNESKTLEKQF